MSDQLANDPAARDSSGAIIDQKTVVPPTTTETPSTLTEPKADTGADATVETPADPNKKPSLLNEGDKPEDKKPDAPVVPEKYEPFKVPDGFTLDETVATEAGALFKGMNLTQDQAQSLVDFYTAKTLETAQAPYKLWADTQEAWVNEIKADPEIGPKLPNVKQTISKAIDTLPAPLAASFREAMDFTGAGNNPAFIKAFYAFAQHLTEGSHVSGRGPSAFGQSAPGAKPQSAASAMYPGLPSGR